MKVNKISKKILTLWWAFKFYCKYYAKYFYRCINKHNINWLIHDILNNIEKVIVKYAGKIGIKKETVYKINLVNRWYFFNIFLPQDRKDRERKFREWKRKNLLQYNIDLNTGNWVTIR